MLKRKHMTVLNFYNNISKVFFRMKRDNIDLPKSNTTIIYTHVVGWYVVK